MTDYYGGRGFTLIECVLALLALCVVLLGVTNMIALSSRASTLSEDKYKSGMLLSGLVAELRHSPPDFAPFPAGEISDIWAVLPPRDCEYTIALKIVSPDDTYYFSNAEHADFFDAAHTFSHMSPIGMPSDGPVIVSSAGITVEFADWKRTPLVVTAAAYTRDGRFLNIISSYIEVS